MDEGAHEPHEELFSKGHSQAVVQT
jgi:hypothetical protein